jgi:alcohol dehydrogenase class IV
VSLSFELATATRIIFGAGKLAEAGGVLRDLGATRVLVVTGRSRGRAPSLMTSIEASGLVAKFVSVSGEPTLESVRDGVRACEGCDAVIACGGGSALDAGKAIAVLATNGGDPLDYLEVIGRGRALVKPSLPFVAIPTTAGTGSEVTKNAVLASKEAGVKASLRSAHMLPRVAIVDPDLLIGAPRDVIASSGLDALSQLIEPFLSIRASPITDALAREGIRRSVRSLRRAFLDGPDAAAREDLALASLLGGICLANAGLGAVHGFAAPIGGAFDAPHGAVCAALLAPAFDVNLRAVRARGSADLLERFDEVARIVLGKSEARAADAVPFFESLRRDLSIPGLTRYGMRAEDVEPFALKAKVASSMKANPIALTDEELIEIARRAL